MRVRTISVNEQQPLFCFGCILRSGPATIADLYTLSSTANCDGVMRSGRLDVLLKPGWGHLMCDMIFQVSIQGIGWSLSSDLYQLMLTMNPLVIMLMILY